MQRELFHHNIFTVELLRAGSGSHPVLCFHGFGREAEDFVRFSELLNEDEYLISINLFQHGQSIWPRERAFRNSLKLKEHQNLIRALLRRENADSFSMLAYSMGGRIALSTIPLFRDRIRQVLLVAPDGLKVNQLYKFASGTRAGRSIYKGIMKRPGILLRSADAARSLRLINEKLHRFIYVHMDKAEKRKLVYETWLIYRQFEPDLDEIARIVNANEVHFQMVFGRYDSVIRPKLGRLFNAKLKRDHLHLTEAGHQLMTDDTVRFISSNSLWK